MNCDINKLYTARINGEDMNNSEIEYAIKEATLFHTGVDTHKDINKIINTAAKLSGATVIEVEEAYIKMKFVESPELFIDYNF